MKLTIVIKFIICLALTFSAAFIGSIFTRDAVTDWYATLNKPFFTPPDDAHISPFYFTEFTPRDNSQIILLSHEKVETAPLISS